MKQLATAATLLTAWKRTTLNGWTKQLLEKGKRPSADNLDDFVAALYEVGDQ